MHRSRLGVRGLWRQVQLSLRLQKRRLSGELAGHGAFSVSYSCVLISGSSHASHLAVCPVICSPPEAHPYRLSLHTNLPAPRLACCQLAIEYIHARPGYWNCLYISPLHGPLRDCSTGVAPASPHAAVSSPEQQLTRHHCATPWSTISPTVALRGTPLHQASQSVASTSNCPSMSPFALAAVACPTAFLRHCPSTASLLVVFAL
jgi:hypothetical protein